MSAKKRKRMERIRQQIAEQPRKIDLPKRQVHICKDCLKPIYVEREQLTAEAEGRQAAEISYRKTMHRLQCESRNRVANLLAAPNVAATRSLPEIVQGWRR